MRRCSDCGEVKALDEFHRNRNHKAGRQYVCKACTAEYQRGWFQRLPREKRVRMLEANRDWHRANREKDRERHRAWRAAYPDKVREQQRRYYERKRAKRETAKREAEQRAAG